MILYCLKTSSTLFFGLASSTHVIYRTILIFVRVCFYAMQCCLCLWTVTEEMGREIGCCRAKLKKALSTLEWPVAATESDCCFANNLHHYTDIQSSSAESGAHKASEHTQACIITALDLSWRCTKQVSMCIARFLFIVSFYTIIYHTILMKKLPTLSVNCCLKSLWKTLTSG